MQKTLFAAAVTAVVAMTLAGCKRQNSVAIVSSSESIRAKEMLQGIWMDSETEEIVFRVEGDTIFYADSTSAPAYFRIVDDSMQLGTFRYAIEKQSEHTFWFRNQSGDLMKLARCDDPQARFAFKEATVPHPIRLNELVKSDSVVVYNSERYHWYITINPTKYRVSKTSFSDEGIGVETIYYDNIINLTLYKGAQRLFSRDIRKQAYASDVPQNFLNQSVLGNMQFEHIDQDGFHFDATLSIPDGESSYLIETIVSFDGQLSTRLRE